MDNTKKVNEPTTKLKNVINDSLNVNNNQEIRSVFSHIDMTISDIKNQIIKILSLLGRAA